MFNSNALEYYGVNLAPSPTFDLFLPKKKKKKLWDGGSNKPPTSKNRRSCQL